MFDQAVSVENHGFEDERRNSIRTISMSRVKTKMERKTSLGRTSLTAGGGSG